MSTEEDRMSLRTEFEFVLPKGYIDKDGNLHREGTMRLANAKDEILPLQDPRVVRNQGFLIVILLSRVITRLGDLREINPGVIENLFAADLSYLQNFYNQINAHGRGVQKVSCPDCDRHFEVELSAVGES
jgi:hypothetical protein